MPGSLAEPRQGSGGTRPIDSLASRPATGPQIQVQFQVLLSDRIGGAGTRLATPSFRPGQMGSEKGYTLRCTLTFGDIYAQILIWIVVIVASLAAGLALMGATKPVLALVGVGLILVLSLPFLLFAFTTTLLNHIALDPVN